MCHNKPTRRKSLSELTSGFRLMKKRVKSQATCICHCTIWSTVARAQKAAYSACTGELTGRRDALTCGRISSTSTAAHAPLQAHKQTFLYVACLSLGSARRQKSDKDVDYVTSGMCGMLRLLTYPEISYMWISALSLPSITWKKHATMHFQISGYSNFELPCVRHHKITKIIWIFSLIFRVPFRSGGSLVDANDAPLHL